MKKLLVIAPIFALVCLVGGILVDAIGDSDAIRHFETPSADEMFLDLAEPFGDLTLEGTIVGATGDTLVDACVFTMSNDVPCWDRTNEAGHFRFERLSEGPWRVIVVARKYVAQIFEVTGDSRAITLSMDHPVAPYTEIPVLERSKLSGRLIETAVDEFSATELEGFEMFFRPRAPLDELSSPFPRRAIVDAEGRFEIDALIHGRYEVIVLPDWAQGGTWPNLCAEVDRDFEFSPQGDSASTSFELERGILFGQLTDTTGGFVEGALIIVERLDDARFVWPPVPTDADGNFLVADLPPDAYRITARAGGGSVTQKCDVQAGFKLHLDLDPLDTQDG